MTLSDRLKKSNFREDALELLEGLMIGVCRVRMSLTRDDDFFFFILEQKDYTLPGYKTFFQSKKNPKDKTRLICLVKEQEVNNSTIILRQDLMSEKFPSIWLELKQEHKQNILICGIYREWSKEGLLNLEEQLTAFKILTKQIEAADLEKKNLIVMGDVNLCSSKWNEADFKLKTIAEEIKSTLAQCGMENIELGPTYLADRHTFFKHLLLHSAITSLFEFTGELFMLV